MAMISRAMREETATGGLKMGANSMQPLDS
jgi:hypothetical protein